MALPIIILWGMVMPILLAFMIKRNNSNIERYETEKNLYFIVKGYKQTFPSILWESYYMLRKLMMVVVVVFAPLISVSFSISLCIGMSIIALLIQIKYAPFTDDIPNMLEKISIGSTLIVYFAGSYFENKMNSNYDIIIAVVMFLAIVYFFSFWSLHFMRLLAVIIQGKLGKFLLFLLKNPENLVRYHIEKEKNDPNNINIKGNDMNYLKNIENDLEFLFKSQSIEEINEGIEINHEILIENKCRRLIEISKKLESDLEIPEENKSQRPIKINKEFENDLEIPEENTTLKNIIVEFAERNLILKSKNMIEDSSEVKKLWKL